MSVRSTGDEFKDSYGESRRRVDDLYESLFSNCHSVMLLIHPKSGDIRDANEAACAFYGYSRQQITGMNIKSINTLPPGRVAAELRNAEHRKRSFLRFRHRLASGEIKDVEVMSGPIEIGNERILFSIIHDVTERKRLEEAVAQEKNLLDSLIRSLPGIMYLFDEFGKLHRWNDNLRDVSGYSDEEIEDMTPLDFIAAEDNAAVKNAIDEVFRKGRADIESRFLTKEGLVIPYFLTGFRMNRGGTRYLVGVGIDIEERKQAETEKADLIRQLRGALSEVKRLSRFLPICASCKKIRDDRGYWSQIETYIREHSEVQFTHGICPECQRRLYPDI